MYDWDPDEEPTGDPHRRTPPRRNRPREAFDYRPREAFDYRPREAFDNGPREPFDAPGDPDMYGSDPDEEPTGAYRRTRRRPASRSLRTARRRVVSALGWVGVLVIGPLFVGILAGAAAGMMHL